MNFGRTARNIESLAQIYGEKSRELTGASEEAKGAAVLWCVQGDAAAEVGT